MSGDAAELERRFAQLVDASHADRAAALRELHAGQPELARRLARLLDAHETTHDPLATLERAVRDTRDAMLPEALIGKELGGWRLSRVIGRGGRTAKALRTLISALADGRRVRVDVSDD